MAYLRLAKPCDAKALASLHWDCSAKQPGGFMFQMGRSFLTAYYRILLQEKNSVVLCAVDEKAKICGLASGSLAAEEHFQSLRQNRLRLLLAATPYILRRPSLLVELRSRQRSISVQEGKTRYVISSGARGEYWACAESLPGLALDLYKNWLSLMRLLGARQVKIEVDCQNPKVKKMHSLMGAKVLGEFSTPDGRQRVIMEYTL
jgi:hypothetical protein